MSQWDPSWQVAVSMGTVYLFGAGMLAVGFLAGFVAGRRLDR